MTEYLKKILEEYEYQLSNATNSEMDCFWQGAIFAIKVAILSAQSKEVSE